MSLRSARSSAVFGSATFAVLLSLSASPFAQAPASAATHIATFDVGGATYAGATTFIVDKTGKVTGAMKLDSPAIVDAKLNGDVKDGVWTFHYPFTMDNQGQLCSGTVGGTAKVTGDDVAGSVTIDGTCSPDALTGTFAFKRKPK